MASIVFDFDGVLVRSRYPNKTFLWSETLEKDLGISPQTVGELFSFPEWLDVLCGNAEAELKFKEVLSSKAPEISSKTFIEYWLSHDLNWREDVLDYAKHLQSEGHEIFVGTNQDQLRRNYIRENPRIKSLFKQVIASADLGFAKPRPEFFQRARAIINSPENQIILLDDNAENISVASACGWRAIHFDPDIAETPLSELQRKIAPHLQSSDR